MPCNETKYSEPGMIEYDDVDALEHDEWSELTSSELSRSILR